VSDTQAVYLFVHELFGIHSLDAGIRLVTPDIPACKNEDHTMHKAHTYKIARFKDRTWQEPDVVMQKDHSYTLRGVQRGKMTLKNTPPRPDFNAHPKGKFAPAGKPYCQWNLLPPLNIHQVRLLSIPARPLFTGKHGDLVDKEVKAIGLVQVFEYARDPKAALQIVDEHSGPIGNLDYELDETTRTVNLHIWAEIENEAGMDDNMAKAHSQCATEALKALFKNLDLHGEYSLSVDNWFKEELPLPGGVRFVELMTLSERYALLHPGRGPFRIRCSAKTCGHGSNLFVDG
jgi:hypothetical protein